MLRIWDKIYTFQYFPPSSNPRDVSGGKPPKPPFPGATSRQSSVYYYWWLFLRENADYIATCENGGVGPCTEIYRDFGDVRDNNFRNWWEDRGCELFCELDEMPQQPIVRAIYQGNLEQGETDPRRENDILIAVHRHANLNAAMAEIRELLEMRLMPNPDQPASTALYPVFTKPVLHSLHHCYEAHRLRRENPKMPLHEFGLLCGAYTQRGPVDTTTQKASASAAHRILGQAKLLIEYVGQGVFPVMTKSHAAEVPEFIAFNQRRSSNWERRGQWAERGKELRPLS